MISATKVVPTVPVTDLAQASDFYRDVLGLSFLWQNDVSVRFACGPDSEGFALYRRPATTAEHALAYFEVTDLEREIKDLEAKGVEFIDYPDGPFATTGHIAQVGPARAAWFRDPDGNTLGLRQG